ncbi:MAG: 7,8-didemethyl-8-hydroxy-5-deazariboflavin synthase subunit CofG [Methanosarcinaceae archaeon]|nr:7,8-didemethyl-8-hydroxy-5-deazariboflavin synthase subunit CofG [Methanosarcinaceae archaeon]
MKFKVDRSNLKRKGFKKINLPENIVTYSRNVFLPVTNVCRNDCKYCGFKRSVESTESYLMSESDARKILRDGAKAGCSEAMFALGEYPEENEIFRKKLAETGYETTVDYLCRLCEIAIEEALLPHTNAGILTYEELKKLKPYNASMGLMLETTAPVKRIKAHEFSPGKDPALRLSVLENAGKLKIPFTTGLLIGIGETKKDRIRSLKEIRRIHKKYGNIQEVILQNYTPQSTFSGCSGLKSPSKKEMIEVFKLAKKILPKNIQIQMPPNLIDINTLINMGVRDLGGVSPVTIDHINPESDWPEIASMEAELKSKNMILKERLPIYPEYVFKKMYGKKTESLIKELSDEYGYRSS